jgi:hypothetical protein
LKLEFFGGRPVTAAVTQTWRLDFTSMINDPQTQETEERGCPPDFATRQKRAIARYDILIAWYLSSRTRARCLFYSIQTLVIVLSGITPVIVIADAHPFWHGLFPAMSAIFAGLLGIYQFHDSWMRRSVAAESLRREHSKYITRVGTDYGLHLTADQALNHFVVNIEDIAADEVSQWRHTRRGSSSPTGEEIDDDAAGNA